MEKVYLISEDIIKSDTVINDNTGAEFILPAMDLAQNIGLQENIGTALLNKLCDLVGDGSIQNPENQKYKFLLDKYVVDYLKWKVCSEITVMIGYKYRNSGMIQSNNEHEYNSGMKDVMTMKSYYDDKANFFGVRLSTYLGAHIGDYPEYKSCVRGDIKGEGQFNTGIYLG